MIDDSSALSISVPLTAGRYYAIGVGWATTTLKSTTPTTYYAQRLTTGP